jgi:uncharacterized protein YerC
MDELSDAELADVDLTGERSPEPLVFPAVSHSLRRFQGQTGEKLESSSVRYEVVRMLIDGMTYAEIEEYLHTYFNFSVSELTIAAFKRNYLSIYQDRVDRWDKLRYQYVIARITEEMKAATKQLVHEVYELQHLLTITDERIDLIRKDESKQTASYETVLRGLIQTKADLLRRMSAITGSTGMVQAKTDVIKLTALAAQKTLVPHLKDDRKKTAFELFDQEIEGILIAVNAESMTESRSKR